MPCKQHTTRWIRDGKPLSYREEDCDGGFCRELHRAKFDLEDMHLILQHMICYYFIKQ